MNRESDTELRRLVAGLVIAAGGQRAFERRYGVSQAVISRYLAGKPLTMPAARRLYHAYPGLRAQLERAVFQVRHAGRPEDAVGEEVA